MNIEDLKSKLEMLEDEWVKINRIDPRSKMLGRLEMEIHNLKKLIDEEVNKKS